MKRKLVRGRSNRPRDEDEWHYTVDAADADDDDDGDCRETLVIRIEAADGSIPDRKFYENVSIECRRRLLQSILIVDSEEIKSQHWPSWLF